MEEVVMSNEEIPVGSRWRWNGTSEGRFWQVTGHAGESVFMVASDGGSTCTAITSFRNATRIDAPPAVKMGDIVYDPAVLESGMEVEWVSGGGERVNCSGGKWRDRPWMVFALPLHERSSDRVRSHGVRILALPEPAKAEAPVVIASVSNGDTAENRTLSWPPPPERCAPGCTPAAPCWAGSTDDGGCPAWREGVPGAPRIDCQGISADLPPASRHTPPTLRHEGLCIAGWNGRVPRG